MNAKVRDYTVPIGKFPMISETATFAGAVIALDRAQEEFMSGKREQRILLVCDNDNKVVGKLSPIDVVRGLEPDYDKVVNPQASGFISAGYVIESMQDQLLLWSKPLDDLCTLSKDVKIKDFIRRPGPTQIIEADESVNHAFHRFVLYRHDSLFVMEEQKLIGLLRFSDVYKEIVRKIKDVCRV